MLKHARQTAFIATLGTEPQVVTIALDALLARDPDLTFDEVVVIHTDPLQRGIAEAFPRLDAEMAGGYYGRRVKSYRKVPILHDGRLIQDIYSEAEAGAVFTTIYREIARQKRLGRIVHFNAAGGRKGMTIYGMASAQILFDADDRLWLLFSTPEFMGLRPPPLHSINPGDAQLIEVPVLRWSNTPPAMTALVIYDDPMQAVRQQRLMIDEEERGRKAKFLGEYLQPDEARLAIALVENPLLTNDQVAMRLNMDPRAAAKKRTIIYRKLREYFRLRRDGNRETLIALLADYLDWRARMEHRR